jgi:uncharacterized protein
MSSTPLPRQVDVRKLVAADAEILAREPLRNFTRLVGMLEASSGDVEVKLHFHTDESGCKCIDGTVRADVTVLCQRCMQPLQLPIESTFAVAAVWSDDEAGRLPKHLEPYIVGEGLQDIRDLIEDELILCIPYASYHEQDDCAGNCRSIATEIDEEEQTEKPNPFKVLEQLKPGSKLKL